MRSRFRLRRRLVASGVSLLLIGGAMLAATVSGGAATPAATPSPPSDLASSPLVPLAPFTLHFHGQASDDPPCTGVGSADVSACGGPFLKSTATLATTDLTAAHWDPPLGPAFDGTAARNIYDPNWLWNAPAPTVLSGGLTVRFWASCGACSSVAGNDANWEISLFADPPAGATTPTFTTTVTATPSLPNTAELLTASVALPAPITVNSKLVLRIDPVFIDSQQNTHIYYDWQSPCPTAVGNTPCDSTVTFNEVPPPPPPPVTPTRTTGNLTFGPATVVDTQRTEGEPVNFIDKNGNYWESGPYGTSTQLSFIHRSTDGGDQFNVVSPAGIRPDPPPGGGDTDVVVDDQLNAYFVDLEALANLGCAVSNDSGNSWRKMALCVQDAGDDRQWFAADNGTTTAATDNTIFLAYRNAAAGSSIYSTPGSTGVADPVGGLVYQNSASIAATVNSGAPCGQLRFDKVTRNLYYPCAQGDHIDITVGHVDPGQRTGITYSIVSTPASPGGVVGDIFPGVATDASGNLYAVWVDKNNHNVYYSASTDQGQTWRSVVKVNDAPALSNVFPWAQAGAAGNLVVAWYGIDVAEDSDSMISWYNNRPGAVNRKWFGYAALITGANGTTPNIEQDRFTEKPMHYGQICNGGLGCTTSGGDRTMADFFSVFLDLEGGMRFVYNDTTSQHHGAHLFEARQLTGPTALGTALSKPVPTNPRPDPTGDALSPHYAPTGPGANLPQLDFTGVRLSQPNAGTLRVQMTLSSLTSLLPPAGKTNAFWITRFQAKSLGEGGEEAYRILYVGAESTGGAAPTFFAGSGDSASPTPPNAPGDGCVTTTPQTCKIVQYPAEESATGSVVGNSICIDVPLSGFGAGRPINDTVLYNVTAFSGGRNSTAPTIFDVYSDVDATRSFDFTLGTVSTVTCNATTGVRMTAFGAARTAAGIVVHWRTASEADLLGFNVWRRAAGAERKVNRALVPARANPAGASYRFVDRTAKPGVSYRYRLQLVSTSGARSWYGSARVRAAR